MYLASNVKYLRTKLGLTQSELAKELEKTSAAISDYEKGKSFPPLEVAMRITQFFKVKIDDLVSKDLRREDMLTMEGITPYTKTNYQYQYDQAVKQLHLQERLNQLMEHRLTELEREIKEHAPELGKRLGLLGGE